MSLYPLHYDRSDLKRPITLFIVKLLAYSIMIYFGFAEELFHINTTLLQDLLYATTFFLGVNLLVSFGRIIIISWFLRRHRQQDINRNNFVLGISRVASMLNTCTFIIALMILFDIDIKSMFISLSIAAAAIAVLSKDYVSNMINGLIIMFSDRLSLGDKITVGDFEGKIRDITLVNIILQNEDGAVVVIPNSVISSSIVLNQSKQDLRRITLEFELGLIHQLPVELLEKTIQEELSSYSTFICSNSLLLKIQAIKNDLVYYKVQLMVTHRDKEMENKIRRQIFNSILSVNAHGSDTSAKS